MLKVSIIVPVFNTGEYLSNTVNSILSQTYENIELILVNDGSTDNSLNICNSFLYDKRVKVITQKNAGVSVARNKGIENATGDWIMFIDSDDYIENNMLYSMIENMKNNKEKIDFIFCGFKKNFFNSDNKNKEIINYFCENQIIAKRDLCINIELFLKKCLLQGPWAKLFNTNIIKKNKIQFKNELSYGEDTLFVYNYLKYASNILCLKDTFYNYNVYNNSSLNLRFRRDKLKIHIMLNNNLENLIKDYNINYKKITNSMLITSYISYCGELCKSNYSKKEIYSCLKEINSYEEVVSAFKVAENSLQNRIIKICIFQMMYKQELMYFKLKEKIRKNKKLFNFLLGRKNDYGKK